MTPMPVLVALRQSASFDFPSRDTGKRNTCDFPKTMSVLDPFLLGRTSTLETISFHKTMSLSYLLSVDENTPRGAFFFYVSVG
ncbi:hypothetical protein XFF7766_810002 [Xanthomonas citri pv. fuscans]|nr:hypothetical protein XFF7766_810002 [Xanthomonas citri pv. fuscans]